VHQKKQREREREGQSEKENITRRERAVSEQSESRLYIIALRAALGVVHYALPF
jgi:hypothetical protein